MVDVERRELPEAAADVRALGCRNVGMAADGGDATQVYDLFAKVLAEPMTGGVGQPSASACGRLHGRVAAIARTSRLGCSRAA